MFVLFFFFMFLCFLVCFYVLEVMVGSGGLMGILFLFVGISDIEFLLVVEIFLFRLVVVLFFEFYYLGCLFKVYEIF